MADNGQNIERRNVLRSIVAGSSIVAGAGLASGSSARPSASRLAELEREYGDLETVEELFAAYGEPLRESLVDEGYLQEGTTVSIDSVISRHDFSLGDEGDVAAISAGRRKDTEVTDVRVRQRTDDHEIEYHLNPEIESGYAVVSPLGSDEGSVVFGDGTWKSLASTGCCPLGCDCGQTQCTTDWCDCQNGYNYYYKERYCCQKTNDGYCLCSWESYDCACSEYDGVCPE